MLTYIIAFLLLAIILKVISAPFKLVFKILCNSILGGLVILTCEFFGIILPTTWYVMVLTALLGLPGLGLALVIAFFIL